MYFKIISTRLKIGYHNIVTALQKLSYKNIIIFSFQNKTRQNIFHLFSLSLDGG